MSSIVTGIHPKLIRAYREAKYVAEAKEPITLQIDQANNSLGAILKERNVSTAAFITAHNPYSRIVDEADNNKAQSNLIKDSEALGYSFLNGYGQDVEGKWPKESSILVFGIKETEAENLADKYEQNAFVWINSKDAYSSLRLRKPIAIPTAEELNEWMDSLPLHLQEEAKKISDIDRAWLISVSESKQSHWLYPQSWDLNQSWPMSKPDGSAMGVGTELDRVFKTIAAGQILISR